MRGWHVKPSKLRQLCDTPDVLTNTHMTRRGEIIMVHTNLTHENLMNSSVREPIPECPAWKDSTFTVYHLMFDCAALQRIWRQCFSIYPHRNNPTFVDILGPNTKPNESILFFKENSCLWFWFKFEFSWLNLCGDCLVRVYQLYLWKQRTF